MNKCFIVKILAHLEELVFKGVVVHGKVLTPGRGVVLVETELDVAGDDSTHEPLVDGLAHPLLLDEREDGVGAQAHLYVKREKIAHYGLSFCSNDHFYVLTITNYLTSVNDNIN